MQSHPLASFGCDVVLGGNGFEQHDESASGVGSVQQG